MTSKPHIAVRKAWLTMVMLACVGSISSQTYDNDYTDDMQQQVRNKNFNPFNNDTTKQKEIPKGLYVWTIDRTLGDITPAEVDTMQHHYQRSTLNEGRYGEYNTLGNNYTPRLSRIFTDRQTPSPFLFTDGYSHVTLSPDEVHFTNTLSPITNLSYDNCGDKTNGEDHIRAKFATNAGKKLGFGFDINYSYARGYFQNQNLSHLGATLYGSYLGDRYQAHLVLTTNRHKASENGGIAWDDYITRPEQFSDSYSSNEIPTILQRNWNRNKQLSLFLTHRYSLGFYKDAPLTEEEIKARLFAEESRRDNAERDSLDIGNTEADAVDTDSLQQLTKRVYVPVTSFIHTLEASSHEHIYQAYYTPDQLYAYTYYNINKHGYPGDSIFDRTKLLQVRNTIGIALLEGFNKYAKAGLKAFATHDLRRYELPATVVNQAVTGYQRDTEHDISLGARLSKTQGTTLHYNLSGQTWVAGENFGQLHIDFKTDLNFPLLGDTVTMTANAFFRRTNPVYYQRHYHSKHFWWDNDDLSKTTHTHLEGNFLFRPTKTRLRVATDQLQNYTYLAMTYDYTTTQRTALQAAVRQHKGNISILMAQLMQDFKLGPIHWDNIVTWQSTSNSEVIPLPTINVFSDLYLKFKIANELSCELGASATFFTKYYAPDYCPQLGQFAIQQTDGSKIRLGGYPFVDVYANLHLKHARFFVMMSNATDGMANAMAFLTPHYPINGSTLHIGVSWNFFN